MYSWTRVIRMQTTPENAKTRALNRKPQEDPIIAIPVYGMQFVNDHMPSLRRLKCISVLYSLPKPSSHIQQIHAQLIINGLKSPPLLAKLIELYCGSSNQRIVNYAHLVFQHADKRDIFLFNTLVRCCQPKDSILVFRSEFARADMVFDDYTYIFILGACARFPSASTLMLGTQLHARIVKHGVISNIMVPTTGIHFYAINKDVASARRVFDEMSERSSVTWNAMITGYSSQKEGNKQHARLALLLFQNMSADESGVKPTDTTMLCVISAASQLGMLETGATLHGFAEKTVRGPEDDVYIGTGLVDMYSKCGCLESALSVFRRMSRKNVLTWTAMITGLAIHGKGEQALAFLYEMGANGMKPNAATFTSLFSACCHAGLVQEGLGLFCTMKEKLGVTPSMQHYGCIVDLLGRAGRLKEAYDFIIEMAVHPDAVLWRSLLGACNIHGDAAMGEKVGKHLLQLKEKRCDDLTHRSEDYVALSNVYASAERWNEVETVRQEMRVKGILNQAGCSSVLTVNFDAF